MHRKVFCYFLLVNITEAFLHQSLERFYDTWCVDFPGFKGNSLLGNAFITRCAEQCLRLERCIGIMWDTRGNETVRPCGVIVACGWVGVAPPEKDFFLLYRKKTYTGKRKIYPLKDEPNHTWTSAKAACESRNLELFPAPNNEKEFFISSLYQPLYLALEFDGSQWLKLDGSAIDDEVPTRFFQFDGSPGCGVNENSNVYSKDCNTVVPNAATVCVEPP